MLRVFRHHCYYPFLFLLALYSHFLLLTLALYNFILWYICCLFFHFYIYVLFIINFGFDFVDTVRLLSLHLDTALLYFLVYFYVFSVALHSHRLVPD